MTLDRVLAFVHGLAPHSAAAHFLSREGVLRLLVHSATGHWLTFHDAAWMLAHR